jgi:hypothetical protein
MESALSFLIRPFRQYPWPTMKLITLPLVKLPMVFLLRLYWSTPWPEARK